MRMTANELLFDGLGGIYLVVGVVQENLSRQVVVYIEDWPRAIWLTF